MPLKYLVQPLRHISFLAMFLQYASLKKLLNFESLPNKKYLCWGNETWSEPWLDTYKHTKKLQVTAIFRENTI
jgi:hypothetical protein